MSPRKSYSPHSQEYLPEIFENAIFLADSHFTSDDQKAHLLFDRWLDMPPPQIFLMGDIFQLFIPHIPSSLKAHKKLTQKLYDLSQKTQLFYFEGNHDFSLSYKILPYLHLYPRILQPALFKFKDKIFLLAHGDLFISPIYELYIQSLSSAPILSFLRLLDFVTIGKLYPKISQKIAKKPIKTLKDTNFFTTHRIQQYSHFAQKRQIIFDEILEGHFHTDLTSSLLDHSYHAIPSYYCQKKYLQITKDGFITQS